MKFTTAQTKILNRWGHAYNLQNFKGDFAGINFDTLPKVIGLVSDFAKVPSQAFLVDNQSEINDIGIIFRKFCKIIENPDFKELIQEIGYSP